MKELYQRHKLFFIILIVATIGFLIWFFSDIVICVLIAAVISIIGYPLVELIDKIHLGRIRFPHFLSVLITLVVILALVIGLISFFIPLIVRETSLIASIDGQNLLDHFRPEIRWMEYHFAQLGLSKEGESLETLLREHISNLLDFSIFTGFIANTLSLAGRLFFHFFTVVFLSYFFLSDVKMLPSFVLLLVPEKSAEQVNNIMLKSKNLLSRYFIGLIINILVMIVSYAVALWVVGIKGALVIAFVAGLLNIIPYIGPVIGVVIGIILGVTSAVSQGLYDDILTIALKTFIAMETVIIIDNILYAPLIQGKSVKAHPIEIFLVIIAAGSIGGIPAMIVAVPGYAFLRIVAMEFLTQSKLVRKMADREVDVGRKT